MKGKSPVQIKSELHPRNKHRNPYHFQSLISKFPELAPFVEKNKYGNLSIDFFNPIAVRILNKALLAQHYQIQNWDIPENYLCPAIPGRADYVHYAADLLSGKWNGKIPTGEKVICMDIGVGANCVYPIIGHQEYGWSFIGTDIDPVAIQSAQQIIQANPILKNHIQIRLQTDENRFFENIIQNGEFVDLSFCNPPFYSSLEESQSQKHRKVKNLKGPKNTQGKSNFGGQPNELWTKGGEQKFILDMITESQRVGTSCFWFTTLISKETNLKPLQAALRVLEAEEVKIIPMKQGNKMSRILAWTFLNEKVQKIWVRTRWGSAKL